MKFGAGETGKEIFRRACPGQFLFARTFADSARSCSRASRERPSPRNDNKKLARRKPPRKISWPVSPAPNVHEVSSLHPYWFRCGWHLGVLVTFSPRNFQGAEIQEMSSRPAIAFVIWHHVGGFHGYFSQLLGSRRKILLHFLFILGAMAVISLPPDNPNGNILSRHPMLGWFLTDCICHRCGGTTFGTISATLATTCPNLCAAHRAHQHGFSKLHQRLGFEFVFPAQPSSVWFVFCSHFGHCVVEETYAKKLDYID